MCTYWYKWYYFLLLKFDPKNYGVSTYINGLSKHIFSLLFCICSFFFLGFSRSLTCTPSILNNSPSVTSSLLLSHDPVLCCNSLRFLLLSLIFTVLHFHVSSENFDEWIRKTWNPSSFRSTRPPPPCWFLPRGVKGHVEGVSAQTRRV